LGSKRTVAYRGEKLDIAFARNQSGASPAEEFFNNLSKLEQTKLMVLFKMLADSDPGRVLNPEKFGRLGDGLFEFKSFQIRMPYAYASNEKGTVIISHGFIKKKDKAPSSEIERARRILAEDDKACKVFGINDEKAQKAKRRKS